MNSTAQGPDLSLTADQEFLLRTALSSNPRGSPRNSGPERSSDDVMAKAASVITSPTQDAPGSGQLDNFDESPFLDYELEDGTFEWDNAGEQMFGDLPGTEDGELHDKRKASDDDGDGDEGTSKRREGEEKTAKKPGRKPLTGEPTTKRKAQNRAAQRAFRERKERHLKDLELKVDDLEKASEATNHENGRLRAHVDKLNMELREYRKRLSLNSTAAAHSPPLTASPTRNPYGANSTDFQFAFPKFGDLPGTHFMTNGFLTKTSPPVLSPPQPSERNSSSSVPGIARKTSSDSPHGTSRSDTTSRGASSASPLGETRPNQASLNGPTSPTNNGINNNNFQEFSGLFSPSILENASRNSSVDYLTYNTGQNTSKSPVQGSTNSSNGQGHVPKVHRASPTSITASPASSMSHNGLDSSCGTTPEPSADSPEGRKPSEGTLNTINEEGTAQNITGAPHSWVKSPSSDINGIDWLAQQNGGQFDPVLFGDFRDPQDNILNNSFDDFFNDAFVPQDFTTPFNTGDVPSPQQPKRDLMKEIEVQQNSANDEPVPADQPKTYLGCDKLWDRVQRSEKFQAGGVDMDNLCLQLKAKAKCSERGAIVDKKDVDHILGPDAFEPQDILKMFSR